MKEKIKKISIIIGILIIGIAAFSFWKYEQLKIKECKLRCQYQPIESLGVGITEFIWVYVSDEYRGKSSIPVGKVPMFQTQEQCIDYCVARK